MEKQCVLVVDDDREIANAIAINLRNEGYKVRTAHDGLEAL
ncbi:MAG TPA: DNA-binding response regulator, partial [Syntrophomonas sp.]|nr:DNA-binding response regulator [Syntrophomonas sp.]